jgi:hypothetical protein
VGENLCVFIVESYLGSIYRRGEINTAVYYLFPLFVTL